MMYRQHAIVEGKHLGTWARGATVSFGEESAPYPHAYFCPNCAEIWARFPVDEGKPAWIARSNLCRKCWASSQTEIAGSLWWWFSVGFNNTEWSDGMIAWEFARCMEYAERQGWVE